MRKLIIIFTVLILNSNIVSSQDYWEILNTPPGISIFSIDVNSNGDIFIGTGGGVYRSIDEGISWEMVGLENKSIYSLEINDLGQIYTGVNIGLSNYSIYKSIDNGQSWDGIHEGFANVIFIKSYPGGLMFASSGTGSYRSVIRSIDYGDTWEEVIIFPSNTEFPYDIVSQDYNTIYVGTINFLGGGRVYRSEDGGDTWEHFGLTHHYVSSLAINSSGDLFAGTRGHHYYGTGGVFILPTGSEVWTNLNNEELVTSIVINSEDDIYIGCSYLNGLGGVRRSIDNGQTWEIINTGMGNKDIEELILGPEGHLFAVAHNTPTPLFKSVNSTVSIHQNKNNSNFITYNYPNPFSNETTIYFSLPFNEQLETKISIYNSQGNRIKNIIIPQYMGNEQSIKFNSKELPAGIYYYELSAGSIHTFIKMVLQK
jgi:hypothetical protein